MSTRLQRALRTIARGITPAQLMLGVPVPISGLVSWPAPPDTATAGDGTPR